MKTNEIKFNDLIFETFKDEIDFDLIKHSLNNIRKTLIKNHKSFLKFSIKEQYLYCCTIGTIVIHSKLQHMDEHKILSLPKNKYYEYSIDRDFKKIKPILIKND